MSASPHKLYPGLRLSIDRRTRRSTWRKRCAASASDVIEVRQVFGLTGFPQDVQEAARL
jgi:hypothetical protein